MNPCAVDGCERPARTGSADWCHTRSNIRLATKRQNAANTRRHRPGKYSGYKGVSWRVHAGKWVARIADKHLGYFDTEIDAALAYDAAARIEFGDFAYPNFPEVSNA